MWTQVLYTYIYIMTPKSGFSRNIENLFLTSADLETC